MSFESAVSSRHTQRLTILYVTVLEKVQQTLTSTANKHFSPRIRELDTYQWNLCCPLDHPWEQDEVLDILALHGGECLTVVFFTGYSHQRTPAGRSCKTWNEGISVVFVCWHSACHTATWSETGRPEHHCHSVLLVVIGCPPNSWLIQ